ncbi:MAG: hypothetical protein M1816_004534 [Peltula sp. TS41687]|nr:MAG: hypothetical protein M1816_004534 [Peltula sp. TS41687]
MARNLFRSIDNVVTSFEIELDDDYIFLYGTTQTAHHAILRGHLVVRLAEPLNFRRIWVRLKGKTSVKITRETRPDLENYNPCYYHEITVNDSPTHDGTGNLPVGEHVFPFEFVLPGDLPQTVLGRDDAYLFYTLKAVVHRVFPLKNVETRRPLPIFRTLEVSSLTVFPWVQKEEFNPYGKIWLHLTRPVAFFGTAINTKVKFEASKEDNLRLQTVEISLWEKSFKRMEFEIQRSEEKVVSINVDLDLVQRTPQGDQDGWFVEMTIPLPASLHKIRQDVRGVDMQFTHFVKAVGHFKNKEVSFKMSTEHPIIIVFSPRLPVGPDLQLLSPPPTDPRELKDFMENLFEPDEEDDTEPSPACTTEPTKGDNDAPPSSAAASEAVVPEKPWDLPSYGSRRERARSLAQIQALLAGGSPDNRGAENSRPGRFTEEFGDEDPISGAPLPLIVAEKPRPMGSWPASSRSQTSPGGGRMSPGNILPRARSALLSPLRRLRHFSSSGGGGGDADDASDQQPWV